MTETEFDILDELYFVASFKEIARNLRLPESSLCAALQQLVEQGYVKCFYPDPDTEADLAARDFAAHCQQYFYLATKAGLLAHNSR